MIGKQRRYRGVKASSLSSEFSRRDRKWKAVLRARRPNVCVRWPKKKSIRLPDGGSEYVGVSEPPISDSLKIPPKNLQNKRKTLRARQSFLSFPSIFNAETILGWGPCENVWVVKGKMKEEDFLCFFFFYCHAINCDEGNGEEEIKAALWHQLWGGGLGGWKIGGMLQWGNNRNIFECHSLQCHAKKVCGKEGIILVVQAPLLA